MVEQCYPAQFWPLGYVRAIIIWQECWPKDDDPGSCPACPTYCVYTCISHHRTCGLPLWHFTGTVNQQSVCIGSASETSCRWERVHLVVCTLTRVTSCLLTQVLKQLVNVNLRVFMNCQSKLSDLPLKRLEGKKLSLWQHIESPSHFTVYLNLIYRLQWHVIRQDIITFLCSLCGFV